MDGYINRSELSYNPVLTQIARQKILSKVTTLVDRGDAVDQFKMRALYPIERAYDHYMRYVDLLDENGMRRFERKRFAKDMMAVFDDYQRRRDRLSHIDPVEFSDIIDIYDEVHKKPLEIYKWCLSQALMDSGISGLKSDILICLFSAYTMLTAAAQARELARMSMFEQLGMDDFREFDFIDFNKATGALYGSLRIETKGVRGDLDIGNTGIASVERKDQAVADIVRSLLDPVKFEEVMRRLKESRNE